jgi:hypothetical protein
LKFTAFELGGGSVILQGYPWNFSNPFNQALGSSGKKDWPTSIRSSRRIQGWAWEEEGVAGGGVPTAAEALVYLLQQEVRELLGWLDWTEKGRREGFDGNRNSPVRQ